MMKSLVVTNQKGGVGKTTVATHLAYDAQERGLKTLFIDCDTQGNSSYSLDKTAAHKINTLDLFKTEFKWTEELAAGDLVLAIGSKDLAKLTEDDIVQFYSNLEALAPFFDLCLMDTAPTIGVLQTAPIVTANFAIAPFELERYSYDGLGALTETVQELSQYNESIKFLGILPNRVIKTSKRQMQILEELKASYGSLLFGEGLYIPFRQSISEANELQMPVWKIKKSAARDTGKYVRDVNKQIFQAMEI